MKKKPEFQHISEMGVYSWSPGGEGEGVPCTQVHLVSKSADLTTVTRFKSRAALDDLIAALIEHRDHVWPEPVEGDIRG